MSWNDGLTKLQDILCDLYRTEEHARQIVAQASMDDRNIDYSDARATTWFYILEEADKQHKVEAVVEIAVREYPNRITELSQALDLYLNLSLPISILSGSDSRQFSGSRLKTVFGLGTAGIVILFGLGTAGIVILFLYCWISPDCPPSSQPPPSTSTPPSHKTPVHKVPKVIGLTLEDAKQQLSRYTLHVEATRTIENERAEGVVVASTPAAGREVAEDSGITLVISSGPGPDEEIGNIYHDPDGLYSFEYPENWHTSFAEPNIEWPFGMAVAASNAELGSSIEKVLQQEINSDQMVYGDEWALFYIWPIDNTEFTELLPYLFLSTSRNKRCMLNGENAALWLEGIAEFGDLDRGFFYELENSAITSSPDARVVDNHSGGGLQLQGADRYSESDLAIDAYVVCGKGLVFLILAVAPADGETNAFPILDEIVNSIQFHDIAEDEQISESWDLWHYEGEFESNITTLVINNLIGQSEEQVIEFENIYEGFLETIEQYHEQEPQRMIYGGRLDLERGASIDSQVEYISNKGVDILILEASLGESLLQGLDESRVEVATMEVVEGAAPVMVILLDNDNIASTEDHYAFILSQLSAEASQPSTGTFQAQLTGEKVVMLSFGSSVGSQSLCAFHNIRLYEPDVGKNLELFVRSNRMGSEAPALYLYRSKIGPLESEENWPIIDMWSTPQMEEVIYSESGGGFTWPVGSPGDYVICFVKNINEYDQEDQGDIEFTILLKGG